MFPISFAALLAVSAAQPGEVRLADLPDEASVHLGVALTLGDSAGVAQLLAAQRDPASPSYRAWLDPQTFGARFGLSDAEYAGILDWFASRGFAVTAYPNRSFFEAVGRVDAVRSALAVQLHGAELAGRRFRTFDGEVSLPADIQSRILHISGLDTRQHLSHRPDPRILAAVSDAGVLGPDDLRLEYSMNDLVSGGQAAAGLTTVVLGAQEGTTTQRECFSGGAGSAPFIAPSTTAIQAYFTLSNATATYNPIILDNSNGDFETCGANEEYQLDVEMQSVGAANAKNIDLVLSPASEVFVTGVQYIVNSLPDAVVVSTSLGACEAIEAAEAGGGPTTAGSEMQSMQQAVQQGLAEGQTWFAASGDNGADDCQGGSGRGNGFGGGNATVDFPGVMPEIMDMGGTQFASAASWNAGGSLLAAVAEAVWNETSLGGGAAGGGQSRYFTKPDYQDGVGPEASDGARDVPDLALEAASGTPGVAVYACGSGQDISCQGEQTGIGYLGVVGGTSVASPLAAGMFALLAGQLGCRQGDVHSEIYALGKAQQSGGPTVFNDITSGNNDYRDVTGFSAGTGYDLASGWGSIDLAALVVNWPACGGSSTGGTTTGGSSSGTSGGPGRSSGSTTGNSGGGTTGGGTTGGGGTGAGSSLTQSATSTSTGGISEGEVTSGGCNCGNGGAGAVLVWMPLGFLLLRRRR